MNNNTLLIFDIDDTLTKTAWLHQQAFIQSLNEIGVESMDTNFGEYLHHTDSFISKMIYEKEVDKVFTEKIRKEFEELLSKKMEHQNVIEVPGASVFISALQQNTSFATAFATGSLRRPAVQKLKAIGISFQEDQLFASDEVYDREGIILKAIENAKKVYSVDFFKRIISFGDGLWDLKAANNLELEFVGVGNKNKEVLLRNGCTKHITNFINCRVEDF